MAGNSDGTFRRIRPPVLHNGDTLRADEYLRRFCRMPEVKKAELIGGVVFMEHRVCVGHGDAASDLMSWLSRYSVPTAGTQGSIRVTTRLDDDNVVQPDVTLSIESAAGGRTAHSADGYLVGGAELVAEVAMNSDSFDAVMKPRLYAKHGVAEYVLWRVEDEAIDWWTLRDGAYHAVEPDPADGLLKSAVYPGLWLDKGAMLRGDVPAVLAALHLGLASPEHAAFVAKLHPDAGAARGTLAGPADL